MRKQRTSCEPSVQRSRNQRQRWEIMVAYCYIRRSVGCIELSIGPAARLQDPRICGIRVEDPNIGLPGEHTKCLIGRPALRWLSRTWKVASNNCNSHVSIFQSFKQKPIVLEYCFK